MTAKWTLDPSGHEVTFKNKTFWGLATVRGVFKTVHAEGVVADDGTAEGTVTVDAASLDTRLAKRDLIAAADALAEVSRSQPGDMPELASQIDPQQVGLLATMQAALGNMLKWEGFQEMVTMLRQILQLQKETNEETAEEIERQAASIFDDP